MNGEKLSVDVEEAILYCDESADTIFVRGYCMDQIFDADETDLNYKTLSSKTLTAKADRKARKAKEYNEHVTTLTCTNASKSF